MFLECSQLNNNEIIGRRTKQLIFLKLKTKEPKVGRSTMSIPDAALVDPGSGCAHGSGGRLGRNWILAWRAYVCGGQKLQSERAMSAAYSRRISISIDFWEYQLACWCAPSGGLQQNQKTKQMTNPKRILETTNLINARELKARELVSWIALFACKRLTSTLGPREFRSCWWEMAMKQISL